MCILQVIYRYNLIYVLASDESGTGLFYPRAWLHLATGLYLAEMCLSGLFFLKHAYVPMSFMIFFFVITIRVHYELNRAVSPLLHSLPRSLFLEKAEASDDAHVGQEMSPQYAECLDNTFSQRDGSGDSGSSTNSRDLLSRAWEPAKRVFSYVHKQWLLPNLEAELRAIYRDEPPNQVNRDEYPVEGRRSTYLPPEIWLPSPTLWLPQDEAGVSRQEVEHGSRYTPTTNIGATLRDDGRIVTDVHQAPINEARWGRWRWEAVESLVPSWLSPSALGL